MITRDFFLRMIQQLAQALARVLKLSEVKQFDEALEEVQRTSKKMLGMDLRMLTSLSDEEFIRLMSLGERFDVEKCVVIAELLRVVGDVNDLRGNEGERHHCYTTSLSLLIELLLRESGTLPKEYFDEMEMLMGKLSAYKLSVGLREKLVRYYEATGRFDAAENILFDVVKEDPVFVTEGLMFYQRLRRKSEEDLVRGNLTHEEVEASIKDLERQTKKR
jgi:hypothetical protein